MHAHLEILRCLRQNPQVLALTLKRLEISPTCPQSGHGSYHLPTYSHTLMGPIGMPEMMMIFIVALLLFGAKKLPELARGVGKAMGEFKKARDEFEREISHVVTQSENEARTKEVAASASQEPVGKEHTDS